MNKYKLKFTGTALVEAETIQEAISLGLSAIDHPRVSIQAETTLIERKNQMPKMWKGPPLRAKDILGDKEGST